VRGPTTHQLWRFAARIKGISREFGVCYSCGGELSRAAASCSHCSRSQELPENPDALLENIIEGGKTVYREVKPETVSGAMADDSAVPSVTSPPPQMSRPMISEALKPPVRPATPQPTAAATMAELADLPSPESAPPELQSRPRQRPQEGVLSARELAAAFSLQYDPKMGGRGSRGRKIGRRGWIAAGVLVLLGGVAAAGYFDQSLHQQIIGWVSGLYPSSDSKAFDQTPATAKGPGMFTDTDMPGAMKAPVDSPPITGPAKPATVDEGVAASETVRAPVAAPVTNATPAAAPVTTATPAPAPALPKAVPAAVVIAQTPPPPAPVVHQEAPVSPVAVDASLTAAAANAAKLKQKAIDDDTFAMELRANGMEAEARHDYEGAAYYYQAVEQLSRDHWPVDIDQRLKEVQKLLNDQ
jgi:hypothetical protein